MLEIAKHISALTLAVTLLGAGQQAFAQDKFILQGQWDKKVTNKAVVLRYKDQTGKERQDTVALKKGRLHFEGTTAYGNRAYLSFIPTAKGQPVNNDYQQFYLEKGKYTIKGDTSMSTAQIRGTQAQLDHLKYEEMVGKPHKVYQMLAREFMDARSKKDSAGMAEIQQKIAPVYQEIESQLDAFIFSHPDSWVALDAVNDNKTMVIDPVVFDPYYKALSARVLASYTGQRLTEKYDKAKQLSIGKSMDFTLPDQHGNAFSLSSLKGKYVLVDFWASWCVPCRAENPHLLKAYNKLKDRGFDIVGISLDDKKENWLHAVKADGMPWIQVGDLKGFKSDIAVRYGITAIPQNVLIDPQGIIIAKNLRGETVDVEIEKLMK